jgi:hypothetical protein
MSIPDQIYFDSFDGNRTTVTFGEDGMHIRNEVEVQDIIDQNTVIRNAHGKGIPRKSGAWRHVARLPLATYTDLVQQRVINLDDSVDRKRFRQWLNDKDNRAFRASEGRV